MIVDIEPKDICVSGQGMPLVGTFNNSEAEWAAALLIMACQHRGDWEPTKPSEIGEAIERHKDDDAFLWMRAMIRDPDFDRLQEDGFIGGIDADRTGAVMFTLKGLLALEESGWVIRTPTEQAAYDSAREMVGTSA